MFSQQCFVPDCSHARRALYFTCGVHIQHEDKVRKLIGTACMAQGNDTYARLYVKEGWNKEPTVRK
jgi:hypothetical protein